jgi:hypothetical protein
MFPQSIGTTVPTIELAPATAGAWPHINIVLNWFEELKRRVPVH